MAVYLAQSGGSGTYNAVNGAVTIGYGQSGTTVKALANNTFIRIKSSFSITTYKVTQATVQLKNSANTIIFNKTQTFSSVSSGTINVSGNVTGAITAGSSFSLSIILTVTGTRVSITYGKIYMSTGTGVTKDNIIYASEVSAIYRSSGQWSNHKIEASDTNQYLYTSFVSPNSITASAWNAFFYS